MHPDEFLPATERHPQASERFRSPPSPERPGFTDLGVWNIFANPDFPASQARVRAALCATASDGSCTQSALLARAVAAFKTPGLRDLSHGGPYMHDGRFDALADVVELYRRNADLARAGRLRSAAPELSGIALTDSDVEALVAFLKSLNVDYQ